MIPWHGIDNTIHFQEMFYVGSRKSQHLLPDDSGSFVGPWGAWSWSWARSFVCACALLMPHAELQQLPFVLFFFFYWVCFCTWRFMCEPRYQPRAFFLLFCINILAGTLPGSFPCVPTDRNCCQLLIFIQRRTEIPPPVTIARRIRHCAAFGCRSGCFDGPRHATDWYRARGGR